MLLRLVIGDQLDAFGRAIFCYCQEPERSDRACKSRWPQNNTQNIVHIVFIIKILAPNNLAHTCARLHRTHSQNEPWSWSRAPTVKSRSAIVAISQRHDTTAPQSLYRCQKNKKPYETWALIMYVVWAAHSRCLRARRTIGSSIGIEMLCLSLEFSCFPALLVLLDFCDSMLYQ